MSKHEARTSLLGESVSDRSFAPSTYQYPMDRTYTHGGYHQREGLAPSTPRDPQKTSWLYLPSSKWQWMFMGVIIFQAIVALVMEGYIFWRFGDDLQLTFHDNPVAKVIPTYLSLFIFGFIYQLFLTYDALRLKNTIQVIGLCLYNLGLAIEAAVQIGQVRDAQGLAPDFWHEIKPVIIALPLFLAVMCLILGFITWKLNDEFAWSIYKHISADLRLKRRYLSYQIYVTLLKFDFFFFLAFTVQFLVIVPTNTDTEHAEFGLTVAAIPVTVVLLFLASYWTRRESVIGMLVIIAVYFGALAYFSFKLVRMYFASPRRKLEYLPARKSLTTFATITIILLVITIIYAVICTVNFNKGLKPHIMSARRRRKQRARQGSQGDMDKLFPARGGYGGYAGDGAGGGYGGGTGVGGQPMGRMEID